MTQRARPAVWTGAMMDEDERLAWEVRAAGMAIGRADLAIDGAPGARRGVTSRFRTSDLVASFVVIHHRLDSVIDLAGPPPRLHTIHSALVWMRGWARDGAAPSHLDVLFQGRRYRLDAHSPVREPAPGTELPALRVACRILPLGRRDVATIAVTVWLSDDARRLPLHIDARQSGMRVVAALIDHTP
ncbi:MAG TPA: hypothetical protein VMZ28_14530 [Kofleriaceae bacterium]|nr:hypothetical protein [Kofleriaceae bacterium]